MGAFRERLAQFQAARESIAEEMRVVDAFEQSHPHIEYFDRVIEGDNPMKQRKDAERQGIKRSFQVLEGCMQDVYGEDIQIVNDAMDAYDRLKLTNEDVVPQMGSEEIQKGTYRDIQENFLFAEFMEQAYEPGSIDVFSHYVTFISLRAFVNLVTRHQDSLKALLDLGIYIPDDLRNRCVLFKERPDYEPNNPEWYIPNLLASIPEAWTVSQDLVHYYSMQARLENPEATLPDNPFLMDDSIVDERFRIRQAIHAYAARDGSIKEIAKRYNLTRRQLEEEIRNAGLLRGHGGRRKG